MSNDYYEKLTMLSPDELSTLRTSKLIESNEIVFRLADLYVAENVITKERRMLQSAGSILNEGKRVLKG